MNWNPLEKGSNSRVDRSSKNPYRHLRRRQGGSSAPVADFGMSSYGSAGFGGGGERPSSPQSEMAAVRLAQPKPPTMTGLDACGAGFTALLPPGASDADDFDDIGGSAVVLHA